VEKGRVFKCQTSKLQKNICSFERHRERRKRKRKRRRKRSINE
jgi:hypothetical protein